jgi:WD40 repeat protein
MWQCSKLKQKLGKSKLIDISFRKLISLQRFQGDFSLKEASLNQCALSFDNKFLATCGDDAVVKLYNLADDFKSITGKQELKNCGD